MSNCSSCGRKLPPFSFGKRLCAWCVQHEAAQRGELPDDARQPLMPAPWQRGVVSSMMLTHALVGINVLIYLAMSMAGGYGRVIEQTVEVQFNTIVEAVASWRRWNNGAP